MALFSFESVENVPVFTTSHRLKSPLEFNGGADVSNEYDSLLLKSLFMLYHI
ncbi:hypothetical protein QF049_002336 [Paenibacillus sp. W4I10]|nr:hypothetical protein [Paenibacillus sp. W4I10]